jgi:cyclopropane-fatty-acyl-phospholipid synthase
MTGLGVALTLVERGFVPDWLIRIGIRRLISQRLREEKRREATADRKRIEEVVDELRASPIAIHPDKANEQHYEIPADLFLHVLGQHLKYSG